MATLTATLSLTSTDATSETTSLTEIKAITVGSPIIGISRVSVAVSGGSDVAIVPSGAANQYVYIKHTGFQSDGSTVTTNQLSVKFASTEGVRISAGEWAFLPSKSDVVVNLISSSTETILVEYAYWTGA